MRILLIHNQYKQYGGEDFVFRSESNLLSQHGHQVDQVLYDNSTMKGVFQKLLSGLKSLYNPDSAKVFETKIRQFNPDVIHVHNFLPLVSPSIFFIAKKFCIPVILTLHNYRLICPSATLFYKGRIYEKSIRFILPLDAIWKGVYRNSKIQTCVVALMTAIHNVIGTWRNKVDRYITLTQFAKEKFQNSTLSIPRKKLLVKPNFVEDAGKGDQLRDDFYLFIGRLTEEKGIGTLLNAASLHNFKLIIIGSGPLSPMIEEAARQNTNIQFLGFQAKPTIIEHLKKCKALIFPSIAYEGFPITILEAFSTGTAVIASSLGGLKEIVKHEINGLHFETGNEKDLVTKIIQLEKEQGLLERLSAEARLNYLEQYTPEKNYDSLLDIYEQVVEQQKQEKARLNNITKPELISRFKLLDGKSQLASVRSQLQNRFQRLFGANLSINKTRD